MWKGATVAAVFSLLAACAANEEQRKAQQDENAKAAAEAEAQIAQPGPCQMPKLWEAWLCGLYRLPLVFKK